MLYQTPDLIYGEVSFISVERGGHDTIAVYSVEMIGCD